MPESEFQFDRGRTEYTAGAGNYTLQSDGAVRTVSREGIIKLGTFIVGNLSGITGIEMLPEGVPVVLSFTIII